jgi:hypothetical protein
MLLPVYTQYDLGDRRRLDAKSVCKIDLAESQTMQASDLDYLVRRK